jgi:hypothetical protein
MATGGFHMNTSRHALPDDAAADDWLDDILRNQTTPQLADEGFTLRVMESLPAVNVRSERQFERWTWAGVIVGIVIAVWAGMAQEPDALASTFASLAEFKPVNARVLAPWLATLLIAAVLSYVMVEDQR